MKFRIIIIVQEIIVLENLFINLQRVYIQYFVTKKNKLNSLGVIVCAYSHPLHGKVCQK